MVLAAVTLLAGCTHSGSVAHQPARAVVLVSGLASISPYTSPQAACTQGLAAGSADTALREHLLRGGHTVYTAPSMAGPGPVRDQTGFGAFGSCPAPLPADLTVDSTGGSADPSFGGLADCGAIADDDRHTLAGFVSGRLRREPRAVERLRRR